jgi:hypothetical protein
MNLWNFKNETKIYWQIKWGEKKKRKRAGVAGLAGFGPATAAQRGRGNLNGGEELAATLARGARRLAHAPVG